MQRRKKCPSCGNMVAMEEAACPCCPYSFPAQEEADIEQVGQQQSWTPLPLLLLLGAAAAMAYFWMTAATSDSPENAPPQAQADSSREILIAAEPRRYKRRPPREQIAAAASIAPKPAAREAELQEWKMRGVIYDLLTLSPLPGCRVVFRDEKANAFHETLADGTGRYRMILPPNEQGYAISIEKEGYASAYLDPSIEDVPRLSRAKRGELARGLIGTIRPPAILEPKTGDPLLTDFYLAPLK